MNNIQDQLTQADPLNHVALHTLPDAAVKALAQEIVMHEQSSPPPIEQPDEVRARSPRRRRHRLMVGLIAGLIVVPTTAAAVVGGMHTGIFATSPPEGYHPANTVGEEFLNSDDPEILTVVHELTREFPLPPGASYSLLLKRWPGGNRHVQRTNVGQDVSYYAHCAWYEYWLKGDASQRAAAQPTIDAIPTWKYWNWAVDDDPGTASDDFFNDIAAETRVGKTTKITGEIKTNCGYGPKMWETPNPSSKP